ESMRELALLRYREFERELSPLLTRFVIDETIRKFENAGVLSWPQGVDPRKLTDELVQKWTPDFGLWLAKNPALEDVTRLSTDAARHLKELGALSDLVGAFARRENP